MAKSDITKDDPLGALMGKGADVAVIDDIETPADDDLGPAQALLDAIHAKDAAGVRDAFTALNLSMVPPGEDDMEMAPDAESGGLIPGEE